MSSSSPRSRHLLLRKEQFKTVSSSRMTAPVASVIEIDIETSKDIGKELLIRVIGFCQTDTCSSDRVRVPGRLSGKDSPTIKDVLCSSSHS